MPGTSDRFGGQRPFPNVLSQTHLPLIPFAFTHPFFVFSLIIYLRPPLLRAPPTIKSVAYAVNKTINRRLGVGSTCDILHYVLVLYYNPLSFDSVARKDGRGAELSRTGEDRSAFDFGSGCDLDGKIVICKHEGLFLSRRAFEGVVSFGTGRIARSPA
jgi:hypothetical protein